MRAKQTRAFLLATTVSAVVLCAGLAAPQCQAREEIAQAPAKATGTGVIKGVSVEERQLKIAHEAIPALNWPGMTMAFKVAPGVNLEGLASGAKVTFILSKSPTGGYVIEQIQPAK